jgi:hypothetical protein
VRCHGCCVLRVDVCGSACWPGKQRSWWHPITAMQQHPSRLWMVQSCRAAGVASPVLCSVCRPAPCLAKVGPAYWCTGCMVW